MTSATRQYRRLLPTQPTTLHNEQLEPRQLMAAVADGHTECQSEHTSDMSVQSFTEMTSKVFGDSGASGLGGKEQSAKPGVNIGKIPLDEMMDHLHDRGMNLDELIENLPRGVAEHLGNLSDHTAFPQPGGSDVPQGEGLFGDWMNPGTGMNPNDPFSRGNNRDTMIDLLTTPTRDRLLFPGESGYEGDSGKDWSAMGSKQTGSESTLREQLKKALGKLSGGNIVGKGGSSGTELTDDIYEFEPLIVTAKVPSESNSEQPDDLSTVSPGEGFLRDFTSGFADAATVLGPLLVVLGDRLENSPIKRLSALSRPISLLGGSIGAPAVGFAAYSLTTALMDSLGIDPLGGVTMDQSQRGLQRSNEGCGGDPNDPDDPANGNQPAERSKPIDLSQGLVGQGNPEEISGGPRGRVYATPRGLELAPSNRPTLMDMLGQPGRGDAGRTVGTHRGFSIDAVINPVPDEGWSAFGSKDS
jgi:hypothetical protein